MVKPVLDTDGFGRQIAALPWRRSEKGVEVMLITSRDTNRFVIPKGWPMKGKTDPQAAAQEALEEAGITGAVSEQAIGVFSYEKVLKAGVLACKVTVYPLEVTKELGVWNEAGQRARRWMTPRFAATMVAEPELSALLAAFAP